MVTFATQSQELGKDIIYTAGKENFCRAIMVAKQVFRTLTEYSDDSLIRTRLFPPEISGLTSFPDY